MASNLKVIIDNSQSKIKIPSGIRMLVRRSCHAALEYEHYEAMAVINVVFADNELLNSFADRRVSNYETSEVIAIPSESGEDLGRLIISVERILELANVYQQSFEMGVVFSAVHGVLNLLGQYYTGKAVKADLMIKEASIMNELGFSPLADSGSFN